MRLGEIVADFATCLERVDERAPKHDPYQPGIGPDPESKTVDLVANELAAYRPDSYSGSVGTGVWYPSATRQKCDLYVAGSPGWAIETKILRLLGDNGKPNGNVIKYILSPYQSQRSALTDCSKLVDSDFAERKAVLIFGYEAPKLPLEYTIDAFETLAARRVQLGQRCSTKFDGLIHPVHKGGAVFAWEVYRKSNN